MASSYHHNFTKTNLVFGIIASSKQSLFLASSYHQNKACFTFHRIIKTTLVSSKQGLFHTSSYHQNNACFVKTRLVSHIIVSSKQRLFDQNNACFVKTRLVHLSGTKKISTNVMNEAVTADEFKSWADEALESSLPVDPLKPVPVAKPAKPLTNVLTPDEFVANMDKMIVKSSSLEDATMCRGDMFLGDQPVYLALSVTELRDNYLHIFEYMEEIEQIHQWLISSRQQGLFWDKEIPIVHNTKDTPLHSFTEPYTIMLEKLLCVRDSQSEAYVKIKRTDLNRHTLVLVRLCFQNGKPFLERVDYQLPDGDVVRKNQEPDTESPEPERLCLTTKQFLGLSDKMVVKTRLKNSFEYEKKVVLGNRELAILVTCKNIAPNVWQLVPGEVNSAKQIDQLLRGCTWTDTMYRTPSSHVGSVSIRKVAPNSAYMCAKGCVGDVKQLKLIITHNGSSFQISDQYVRSHRVPKPVIKVTATAILDRLDDLTIDGCDVMLDGKRVVMPIKATRITNEVYLLDGSSAVDVKRVERAIGCNHSILQTTTIHDGSSESTVDNMTLPPTREIENTCIYRGVETPTRMCLVWFNNHALWAF